jgi:L-lactate dehydrogenase
MAGTASKLTVVGAGAVGSTTAYAALLRGVAQTVALYDLNAAKVEAEVEDLRHGLQFVPPAEVIGSDDLAVVADSDVVVVTAGSKQRPGQTRLDLAESTVRVTRDLMPRLVDVAPRATYLMVTNPVDVITYVALACSGLPRHQLFGSGTVLDSSRLRTLLARAAGVAPVHVHAYVVGEHGDTEFPLWSNASIGGVDVGAWTGVDGGGGFTDEFRANIAREVRDAAYTLIAGKGATNYAIGLAAISIVEALLRDERRVLPVSSRIDGYLGIEDVCLSVPCLVDARGCGSPVPMRLSDDELTRLRDSADAVRAVVRRVGF